MFMNRFSFFVVTLSLGLFGASAFALEDEPLFHSTDPLAARDEWGLLTQGPLNPTDFARREQCRLFYYSQPGSVLVSDPAYVGALQVCLRRKGYYRGPIDGVFSPDVSAAICRLQKAHAMRVTGKLSVPVRRALYLP
jgi:peptidoglycan hydrolase-like protein with peptidoglycan-binding domain